MAKEFTTGSVDWLIAMRQGAFADRPPIPSHPPRPITPKKAKVFKQLLHAGRKAKEAPRLSDGRVLSRAFMAALNTPCCYCRRLMSLGEPGLLPTRDHVHPRSKGGRQIWWACDDCNHLKDNMLFDDWKLYMASTPFWWTRRKGKRLHVTLASASTAPRPPIPLHETKMILRHGKAFWREWKHGDGEPCECCRPAPCGIVTYSADGLPIVPFCGGA